MHLLLPILSVAAFALAAPASNLPVVDLTYASYRANSFNETGGYYNFSNIRYAAPPTGHFRFREPIAPTGRQCHVDNGDIGRVCPQSSGNWSLIASQFSKAFLNGQTFDYNAAMAAIPKSDAIVSADSRTTEDCLFLDVITPQAGFAKKEDRLPVLIYVYGGGYSSGDKTGDGDFNPAELLRISDSGFVYVSINYRLGALGWLAGKEVSANGTLNAGLYDQRLAFEWVQQHIHLFGGDKHRVTVMGGSAGAGSIMHHLTAFGGRKNESLFSQAILLSPAFLPSPTMISAERAFSNFLALLNFTSLSEARKLPSEALIAANALQIYSEASYGSNIYGPVVDGTLAPALPGQLLLNGTFNKDIRIMTMHNTLEGLTFTNPTINSSADYLTTVTSSFPTISKDALKFINTTLYPPVFDGSLGYKDEFQRALGTVEDVNIICNTHYIAQAFSDKAYALRFAVPPGIHGQQTPYVFRNGAPSGVVPSVADALQQYIVSFVTKSVPTSSNGTEMPVYGSESVLVNLATNGTSQQKDDTANQRCTWWQKGLFA
ncbi:Carboxylesterase patB [Colletotrichum siamense]|uniref:Carboxylic ester hydrolase n=1 Tax=Colletotrichum siamense TaxID=690259 RepID=A0A9P5K6A1_COLSI|nr:Carboxylesterase patB [Colletotrichum siamense]KAF4860379.1 Carboxylesterase patB [Colletotrichum siamense]